MKNNKLLISIKILAIVILCLISFFGIYVQKYNTMKNTLKDFNFSKDLKGYREIIFHISDANKVLDEDKKVIGDTDSYDDSTIETNKYTKSDEKVNSEESLNEENYEKVKNVFEKRLKLFGVNDFNISLNKETGDIYLQIPEDNNTDTVVSNITEMGNIELKDSEDGTEYLTSNNLKKARAGYTTQNNTTVACLEIQFDNEGKKKLRELTENEYKTIEATNTTNSTNSENVSEGETTSEDKTTDNNSSEETSSETTEEATQKKLALFISGNQTITTSFRKPVTDGKMQLKMTSSSTSAEDLEEAYNRAATIAAILNGGELPLKYNVHENQYVSTEISKEALRNAIIIVSVIIGILLVYMIIKEKMRGLLAVISYIGFIALYTWLLRYTNTIIALEGIVAGIIVVVLNYVFTVNVLKDSEKDSKKYYKKYFKDLLQLLPIFAISIVFCFIKWSVIASFGMVMFWGILLMAVYNVTVTKHVVDYNREG